MKTTFPNGTNTRTPLNILLTYLIMYSILPLRLSNPLFSLRFLSSRSLPFSDSNCYTHTHTLSLYVVCCAACIFIAYKHAKMTFKWKKNNCDALAQFPYNRSVCTKVAVAANNDAATNNLTYFHLFNRCYIYSFVYFFFFFLFFSLSFYFSFRRNDIVGFLLAHTGVL